MDDKGGLRLRANRAYEKVLGQGSDGAWFTGAFDRPGVAVLALVLDDVANRPLGDAEQF